VSIFAFYIGIKIMKTMNLSYFNPRVKVFIKTKEATKEVLNEDKAINLCTINSGKRMWYATTAMAPACSP